MTDSGETQSEERSQGDPDLLSLAQQLIAAGGAVGIPLRLVGGLAVQLRARDWAPASRSQRDIDLASLSAHRPQIVELFGKLGYQADRRFNALHGHKQMYFVHVETQVPVDVVLDALDMCHRLEFSERIEIDAQTLSLADLLLTKLQIVRINRKDLLDALGLLHDYPLTHGDESGINVDRLAAVVGDDWGWWRTVTGNIDRAAAILDLERPLGPEPLPADSHRRIEERLVSLRIAVEETPKSLKWRIRARIGDRMRWYEEPEEEEHD